MIGFVIYGEAMMLVSGPWSKTGNCRRGRGDNEGLGDEEIWCFSSSSSTIRSSTIMRLAYHKRKDLFRVRLFAELNLLP